MKVSRQRGGSGRAWRLLFVACLLVVGAVDAVLLQLGASYFSGGFNGVYIRRLPLVASFVVGSLAQDAWMILGVWAVLVPACGLLRLRPIQTFVASALAALAVPLLADFVRYQLHHVLGNLAGFGSLWALAGPDLPSALAEAVSYLPPASAPLLALVLVVPALIAVAPRLERHVRREVFTPPRPKRLWGGFLLCGLAGLLALQVPGAPAERVQFGLRAKPSGMALASLGNRLTDWDRDGFGSFSSLRDPDPFDASISPLALDLPGNGIDENGMGGDHPAGFEAPHPVPLATTRNGSRRDVLLVFLESFRGDLLGRRFQGREVTPFLNRLAREGAHSEHAYAHTPATAASRAQLFSGRLVTRAGQPTLIDDFADAGYFVAYFSGQNELYGNSEAVLGLERADRFYDARQDQDRRTSRSTSPVGLQVSWKTLLARVRSFLDADAPAQPLFLYVNVVDTHFPYHHRELDRIFEIDPLEQMEIRADRAERVWETYLDAAANVDRAVEQLVTAWWERRGRAGVILVTGDHGQAIYDDDGYLGHGRSLHDAQARVPFIVWGLGGEWPEPLGLADVRGLLWRQLADPAARPPARFVPDPERLLFGFGSSLDRPRLIGLRSLASAVLYDLEGGRLELLGPDGEPATVSPEERRARFDSLIWSWEALRLENPTPSRPEDTDP